jgi:hypothetical protein
MKEQVRTEKEPKYVNECLGPSADLRLPISEREEPEEETDGDASCEGAEARRQTCTKCMN